MPAGRGKRLASFLVVVREQGGVLFEVSRMLLFYCAGNARVYGAPPPTEQASECHLLGERVLERVLHDRVDGPLVDELAASQVLKRGLEVLCWKVGDRGE